MEFVTEFLRQLYIGLARYPYAVFAAAWIMTYAIRRSGRSASRLAMDVTFFILIGSVSGSLKNLTGSSFGFWFIIFTILTAAGFAGREQELRKGKVDLPALFKWICRPGCLLLACLYVVLRLLESVSL